MPPGTLRSHGPAPFIPGPGGRTRRGTRISKIEHFTSAIPSGEWDTLTVIEGVIGPEIHRLPSTELDKVLPPPSSLGEDYGGYARMHGWGPGFGDETLAGLAYGPHKEANLLQSGTLEAFARWGSSRTKAIAVRHGTPLRVSQYVKHRRIKGVKYPFVRTVRYDFTLEDGTVVSAVLDISESGKVSVFTLP